MTICERLQLINQLRGEFGAMTADQCQQLFFEHERLLKSSNDEATKKKLAETNNKLDQIHERLLEKVDKIGVPGVWRARFLRYLFFA